MRITHAAITRRFGLIRLIRLQAREADRAAFRASAVNRVIVAKRSLLFTRYFVNKTARFQERGEHITNLRFI